MQGWSRILPSRCRTSGKIGEKPSGLEKKRGEAGSVKCPGAQRCSRSESIGTLRFVGEQVELVEAMFRYLERIGEKAWAVDQDDFGRLPARTPAFTA
jgi:hypothetical protein